MKLNKKIDEMKNQLISSTQEVLRIKSVEDEAKPGMPFGKGVSDCLECALKTCRDLGFKTVNLDGQVGYAEFGQGEDYVAILGHLDVVPEGDGWLYPPYEATIHDGKIYARGALDDKGPIMACLYGLKAIADEKLPLSKRVRIIFGTNEETGSKEIEYYLTKEKPPVLGFTPDAEYPIIFAEKGLTVFNLEKKLKVKSQEDLIIKYIKGGLRANMVPEYCEALVYTKDIASIMKAAEEFEKRTNYVTKAEIKDEFVLIKAYGVAAHGSLPQLGKNAIMQMLEFLGTLPLGQCDLADTINFFNKYVGMETCGETFGVALKDEASGNLSFNVGVISVNENNACITLNLRYPVTFTFEDMMKPFKARIENTGFKMGEMDHQKPLYFPADHPLIKTLQKVYKEQTGNEPKLLAIGGGTYAKEMPNTVAFGPIFPGKPDLDHQVNEYIEVEDLILNAKIYAHTIYELAK